MRKKLFLCVLIIASTATILCSKVIHVPVDYPIIQDAITASSDGDTVLIAPGRYLQSFSLGGKKITIASLYLTTSNKAYIDSTVIACGQNSSGIIYCGMKEDNNTKIIGITIGGLDAVGSQGIVCDNSSPVISENIFKTWLNNGIKCKGNSSPTISKNSFFSYDINNLYICIDIDNSKPNIENNLFYGKRLSTAIRIRSAENVFISGNLIKNFMRGIHDVGNKTTIINNLIYNCEYGVFCEYLSNPLLINNTIVQNRNCGIGVTYGIPEVTNCILWGNKKDIEGTATFSHSCIWGCLPYDAIDNGGNVFSDPQFIDAINEDFRLKGNSPCIDAGSSDSISVMLPDYDLDLNKRIEDGNADNISVIDIGCYERGKAINPAYVSGHITLSGGSGKVEDVKVGIGTPVHPDVNGNYQFALSVPDSFYTVIASLDKYLKQEIKDVTIKSGLVTQNVNFNLEYYNPDEIIETKPDTLKFLIKSDVSGKKLFLKNISLADVYIRGLQPYNMQFYFDEEIFSIPHLIAAGDSCDVMIRVEIPIGSISYPNNIILDSLALFFNAQKQITPILFDPSIVADLKDESQEITTFQLHQNYPNPFNPSTVIEYNVPKESYIKIIVYDLLGREIQKLVDEKKSVGSYKVEFDGRGLPSGVYLCRLQTNEYNETRKLLLMK